jgi:hypothetical protein
MVQFPEVQKFLALTVSNFIIIIIISSSSSSSKTALFEPQPS